MKRLKENKTMKQSRKTTYLLIAALVTILLLLFASRNLTRQSPQGGGNTVVPVASPSATFSPPFGLPSAEIIHPSPIPSDYPTHVAETLAAMPPTITPAPTATSTLGPPACTFPLAGTIAEESKPEEYTFSEPQVVLTTPYNVYDIIEWLPDNQRVLLTHELPPDNIHFTQQAIELYNPSTGETQVYATRNRIDQIMQIDQTPLWQSRLNAVIYPSVRILVVDDNGKRKLTYQAWVSYGDPDSAQMIADNLLQLPLAIKSDHSEIIYLLDRQLSRRNGLLEELPPISFDLDQWDYAKAQRQNTPLSYKMIWQPDTSQIFLYSRGDLGGGYTFILNANTGKVCDLNLDGWARKARWSPNGRYLTILRLRGTTPVDSTDLAVLDAFTGNLYTIGVVPQEIVGKHYVDDFVWAPDNHHLLAVGSVFPFSYGNQADSNSEHHELYLVDFISGQSKNILPEYRFNVSSTNDNLAWSSDGSKVLVRCSTQKEARVCFVSVQSIGQ
ncbi:MAG: hypothetical protein AABZ00_11645 [Chloroflexota bacterium]